MISVVCINSMRGNNSASLLLFWSKYMSMFINSSLTGLQNLVALINADNGVSSMTETNVTFGLPTEITPDGAGRNTEIVVTPVNNMDFIGGPQTFTYRRLGLDTQVVSPNLTYAVVDSTTVASLKAVVCAALNLMPSEVDFVETVVARDPLDQGGTGFVTQMHLAAKPESIVYVGTLVIDCTWESTDPVMNNTFPTTALSGFNPVV